MPLYGPERPYDYINQTREEYFQAQIREELHQAYLHETQRLLWGGCDVSGCMGQNPDCGMRVSNG